MNKKIFIILLGVFLCSCNDKICNYKIGDIVYLKPDSTKAVIIDIPHGFSDSYTVRTGYSEDVFKSNIHSVYEQQIY